jgi:two-component system, OmpR family, alkaline phosphatase synthesis response regulator PhoP
MQERILVVDDEPAIVKQTRAYLEKDGFQVLSAQDGPGALASARHDRPDLIILDLMLPGMDGREVCRILRRESDIPIIMLTARAEESDQISGLELGADDYVTKPFSPKALVARVRAILRRSQGQLKTSPILRINGLEIDLAGHKVLLDGHPLHLTPKEYRLLTILAQHPGQLFTREQLIDQLNGTALDNFDRSVDSHIKNLRRKLESDAAQPRFIETIYGEGYRFMEAR